MNRNPSIAILPLTLILIFMSLGQVSGKEIPVGEINKISGLVSVVKSDGREVTATEGLSIFAGDRIVTGKGGTVWFSLQQGRHFRLGEESQVSVDELSGHDSEDSQPVLILAGMAQGKAKKAV